MKTVIVGDLHGDWRGMEAILKATGAIDAQGQRTPDVRTIQLGDLIHGGRPRWNAPLAGVNDATCAERALGWFDEILIGNHDLPHLWPAAELVTFGGQTDPDPATKAALCALLSAKKYRAATNVGKWLLTHAGLERHVAKSANLGPQSADPFRHDAATLARLINAQFTERITTPLREGGRVLFDAVGRRRGGSWSHGGIFWCDLRELRPTLDDPGNPCPQIFGHTPQDDGPTKINESWCVDVGAALSGKVCALVQDSETAPWTPITLTLAR